MITRKSLADEIDQYDQQIADMNSGKKDCFDAYRNQLIDAGVAKPNIKIEIEAVKAAIKRRRASEKDPTALEEKDALTDEIFWEITSAHAPRTYVENIEEFPVNSYAQAKLVETVAAGMQTETGRAALIAAVDIMIEREEQIDPETGEIKESLAERPSDAVSERTAPLVDATASAEAVIEGQPSVTAATSAESAGEAVSTDLPTNSENTPDPRPLTAADGQPGIQSSSPGCVKSDRSPPVVGQGCESGGIYTGSKEEQAVNNFEPPAFLQSKPLKTARDYRPHCQKPDACGASGLQHCYSCSKLIPEKSEVA